MSGSRVLWGQVALVLAIVFTAIWCATEWTAWRLGFQAQLGAPWFEVAGWPFYYPPIFFWWWYCYDAYAPHIFIEGAGIAVSGALVSIVVAITLSVIRAREAKNVATYGSARWAEPEEVKAAGLLGPDGVLLGRLDRDYLRHDGPEHVLCFAPTRSGKGVGLVVPTLLTWPGSVIVHDIKGENWGLTAGFRSRHGRVLLFDPTDPASSAYNPLLEVRRGDKEVRDVQNIADILVDPEGALDKRNHWEKTSHSLLVGAILHVLYAETDKTLAGVANFLSDPKRPVEATLRAMMNTPHLGEAGVHPVIASSARELLNKSDNERSGVLSTAMSFLGLYRDPVVAKVTERCDWRIADLVVGEKPVSLYLVVPPSDINRTKPLIRLLLNQVGRRLTEDLKTSANRHRLLLMLDEFPALGRLDFFESALALRREQQRARQLPCARRLRHQRRAHRQARVGRARHRDRDARLHQLCRAPAVAVAWASHGVAAGDGPPAAHARRGDATPARRRTAAGRGRAAGAGEEGALLRGCAIPRAHTAAAETERGEDADNASRRRLVGTGNPVRSGRGGAGQCRQHDRRSGQCRYSPRTGIARSRGDRATRTPGHR